MKKIYLAIAIIAAATIAAGCSKEPTQPTPVAKEKITLNAGNPVTKTFGTTTIKFNSGDKLSVFDSEGGNNEFSLTSAAASTSGTFEGEITASSTPAFAVYPYSAGASISGDNITITLPAHYDIVNSNSVLRGMNLSIGKITESEGAYSSALKNVCGIVGVPVVPEAFGVTNIKLSANEPLTGTVTFNYNNGEPTVVSVTGGATSVDFDTRHNLTTNYLSDDGTIYFSVLPGTYTGVKLTISLANGTEKVISSANSLVVSRNGRIRMPVTLSNIQDVPVRNQIVLLLNFYEKANTQLYYDDNGTPQYLPTAAADAISGGVTYYHDETIDAASYSFPYHVYSPSPAKFRYQAGSYKCLNFTGGTGSYIVCPAIPGYYLRAVSWSCTDTGKKIRVSNILTDDCSTLSTGSNCYEITPGQNGTLPSATFVTGLLGTTPGQVVYVYPTSATVLVQKLRLLYLPQS